jgi:Sigma 54 modulation/S30EA ribosomal protein C terminus
VHLLGDSCRLRALCVDSDQALDELENVSHDFFVFREKESDSVQVLYKRHSGYGLIVPEFL